jgi:quercetin dioxygenase-like cupin family protein
MEIKRSGSQPSAKGPAEWFTGTVRIDPLFDAPVPARAAGASVTFEPGARTAWHTHPLGQTLMVTSGVGAPNVGVGQSRRFGRVMSSGSRRAKSTGTGRLQRRQ